MLRAAAVWAPGDRWRTLLAVAGRRTALDPGGSFPLVGGAVLVICSALLIAPLAVPVLDAVAAVAVAVIGQVTGTVDHGGQRRPAQRLRAGQRPVRPRHRQVATAAVPVVSVSHLSAVFGLNELCVELIRLVDMPEFGQAYFDYCRYFSVTHQGRTGGTLRLQLRDTAALPGPLATRRLHRRADRRREARRAWVDEVLQLRRLHGVLAVEDRAALRPGHARPGSEASRVSSHDTAPYGIAAIENLALLGDRMPS